MPREFQIIVQVEASTRAEAIAEFERRVAQLKAADWADTHGAGGGSNQPGFSVRVGHRPLSLYEQLAQLKAATLPAIPAA